MDRDARRTRMRDLRARSRDAYGHTDKQLLYLRGVLSDANLFGADEGGADVRDDAPLFEADGFRASGRLGDDYYTVGVFWGGELGRRVAIRGEARSRQLVSSWIDLHSGDYVEILIPGFGSTVGCSSPLAVYAALVAPGARLEEHSGDLPPGWPHDDPDRPVVH